MKHWAFDYIGQAWEAKTHDCWGFFRRVQRERFGRDIPAVEVTNYSAASKAALLDHHPHRLNWVEITREELQDGDGVRMASARDPGHVGIWAEIDGGLVIHCDTPYGVTASPLDVLAEHYAKIKFYRFKGDACQL